ncbi:hypothetical protein SAMN05216428_11010 [Nitrosospira sp. Nsp11]|nr:hypothetical protein SAMN05216315_12631 [Nitrosospira sp. Nsp18]SHL95777.1 hypothetical protein SAMN05216428_11010 [Nitrosospira sp. Nsp11]
MIAVLTISKHVWVLQTGSMTIASQYEISQKTVSPKVNGAFRLVVDLGKNLSQQIVQYLSMRYPL